MRLYALVTIAAVGFLVACAPKKPHEPTYAEVVEQGQIKRSHTNIIKVCISGDRIGKDPETGRLVLNPSSPVFTDQYLGTVLGPDAAPETICQ